MGAWSDHVMYTIEERWANKREESSIRNISILEWVPWWRGGGEDRIYSHVR